MKRLLVFVTAISALAPAAGAQQYQRRATFMNGGGPDRGKCTIEVVVDGAAEIDIRGDQGTIRNLSGQPAQWRRFECTGPLPANPAGFRFAGVDGRGRQVLMREPRNGSPAVVRIEDPQGGSEGYTFDLFWGGGYERNQPPPSLPPPPPPSRRFTVEQAVATCQDAVRQQARFRARRVEFRETRIDDNPGRNDWVIGVVDTARGYNSPEEHMRFSCSVNFDTGQVRSVDLQPMGGGGYGRGNERAALDNCQTAVADRMQRDGYGRIEFPSIRVDDQPGRNDWVVGTVRAERGRGSDIFNFSCSVNLRDGSVRSVDVTRR
uniref:Uncharacterized protein n=1 Tax=Solibacter usitatus (strain Ellin6076) TaxID=234267 RepID=Q01QN5_SOLUE